MAKKLTQEEFIERAKAVHGDRYDYSLVEYKGSKKEVIIICKEHGEFPQKPSNHLLGRNCFSCAGSSKSNTDEFIAKAVAVHGNRYDYSKVDYSGNKNYAVIICKEHGEFPQKPNNHLSGNGCLICAGVGKSDTERFISDAISVHGDKYSYCFVDYIGNHEKVIITCKEHGEFPQTPASHTKGSGCPSCASHGFDKNKPADFYVYHDTTFVGYGISNEFDVRHVNHTRNFVAAGVSPVLVQTFSIDGHTACKLELAVKKHFKKFRVNTGIEGFKTEALLPDQLNPLLSFIVNQI